MKFALALVLLFAAPLAQAEGKCSVLLEHQPSYFNRATKTYFLAVDTCMETFFKGLGFVEKTKPRRKEYANTLEPKSGAIVAGLGSAASVPNQSDLILQLRICCESTTGVLLSCSDVSADERDQPYSTYQACQDRHAL